MIGVISITRFLQTIIVRRENVYGIVQTAVRPSVQLNKSQIRQLCPCRLPALQFIEKGKISNFYELWLSDVYCVVEDFPAVVFGFRTDLELVFMYELNS
jgi:hypothetical protein